MLLKKWIAYRGNPWNDQVSYWESGGIVLIALYVFQDFYCKLAKG